jgi:hypothetical protein
MTEARSEGVGLALEIRGVQEVLSGHPPDVRIPDGVLSEKWGVLCPRSVSAIPANEGGS